MSGETFTGENAVELAVVQRNGFVESRHLGSAAVVNAEGEVICSLGDTVTPVFARSTLKPLQALASLETGARVSGEQLAIACASHVGTALHVALVRDVLSSVHLDESALRCPAAWPLDNPSRDSLIRSGEPSSAVFMECSGKHAVFLAACVAAGLPTETYLHPEHPLQTLVRDTIARFAGEQVRYSGVDGCGAPVHALSLAGLARAMSRFATSQESSPFAIFRNASTIWDAMLNNPLAMQGAGMADSVVIEELGVVAKSGAEGLQVLVAPNGTAVALKVLDGSNRAGMLVGLQLLLAAEAIDAAGAQSVLPKLDLALLGGGVPVGGVHLGSGVPSTIA